MALLIRMRASLSVNSVTRSAPLFVYPVLFVVIVVCGTLILAGGAKLVSSSEKFLCKVSLFFCESIAVN